MLFGTETRSERRPCNGREQRLLRHQHAATASLKQSCKRWKLSAFKHRPQHFPVRRVPSDDGDLRCRDIADPRPRVATRAQHQKREREQAEQLQQTQVELTSVSAHLDASEARSVAMGEKLQSDDSLHAGDREELERRVEAQVAESARLRKERLELEGAHTALGVQFAEQEALQRTRLKDLLRVQGELDSTTTRLRASEARHASLGEKLQVEATRHAEEREELEKRSNEERRQVALLRESAAPGGEPAL